jgi:hypothetical protein
MVKNNITCSTDSPPMPGKQLNGVLKKHGITLNTRGLEFLDFFADGEMVCEMLCGTDSDPKGGPFLMVVKVSLPPKDRFDVLLTELTGDNKLAELFDPIGPAYIRVLRCRPSFWEVLKQTCVKFLAQTRGSSS